MMEAGWRVLGSVQDGTQNSSQEEVKAEFIEDTENIDTECLGDLERKVSLIWAWGFY